MSDPKADSLDVFRDPASRNYLLLAAAALLMYYTQMTALGGASGTLLAIVIAIAGLLARWSIAPPLFLILTTYLLFDPNLSRLLGTYHFGVSQRRFFYGGSSGLSISLLILAASILVYMIAQYRLLAMMHKGMPSDPPPRRRGQPEPETPRRPRELFEAVEIGVLTGVVPICLLSGVVIWLLLLRFDNGREWGVESNFAKLMVFLWGLATLAFVCRALVGYLALKRMNRHQSRLILQDNFWDATRREQERIYLWRSWARRRRRRRPAEREGI